MIKEICLSMHPGNFAFDKIVRKNRFYLRIAGSGVQRIEVIFFSKFSPVTSCGIQAISSSEYSSSLEMASLVALVKSIHYSS